MASTGELWFRITVAALSFIIVVTSIVNLIYYSNAAGGNCQGISSGFATFMLWLNIIMLIVAVAVFFWSMVVIFTTKKDRQDLAAKAKESDIYKTLRSKDTSTTTQTQGPQGAGGSQDTATRLKDLEAKTGRTGVQDIVVSEVANFE